MKHLASLLAVMLTVGMQAQTVERTDTVRVINNPSQVVITESNGEVILNVKGEGENKDQRYEYRIKHGDDDHVEASQREGRDWEINYPFKKCDTDTARKHFEVFLSDLYLGWGGHESEIPYLKQTHNEVGVLNFLSLGYLFNKSRSRVSLGMGFNWSRYGLKNPYSWSSDNWGIVGVGMIERDDFDKHDATLTLASMQFPLMFNQSLGKTWNIAAAAVMNWNYHASFHNAYSIGKSDYSVDTRGLHQRKLSFDALAMISFHGLGAYVRYSPQSVFKCGWGPELKNRWTVGIVLRGGIF